MPEAKPLTPAKVRSVLRKAGFARAKWFRRTLRGPRELTPGYHVRALNDGTPVVDAAGFAPGGRTDDVLRKYVHALWVADIYTRRFGDSLVILRD